MKLSCPPRRSPQSEKCSQDLSLLQSTHSLRYLLSLISVVTDSIVHHLRNKVQRSNQYLSHLSVLPVHYSTVSCTNFYTTCLHVQEHSFRYSQFSSLFLRFGYCKRFSLLTIVRPLQLVVQLLSFSHPFSHPFWRRDLTNFLRCNRLQM